MKDKLITALLVSFFVLVAITIGLGGLAATGKLDPNPYTETVQCTVAGDTTQAALGAVFVFNIDSTKSVKLQKSKCINMGDVSLGDSFTAVMVMDKDDVLQCIVKVD